MRTILLADDSPTIRRLVTQTFADANFKIVEVNNGDAAIKTFEEVKPNIVLADIYMPGQNGYQVCTYIRKHPQLGQTPVVLLVGAFDAFDEDAAKESGATASITKPFEPGALIDLVKSVLEVDGEAPAATEPQTETGAKTEPPAQAASAESSRPAEIEMRPHEEGEDLLGLGTIFKEEETPAPAVSAISEQDIERIADRVIQKVSAQVIESIAWDIIPDITEKIVREELKRNK
jgi:CheY-like chemotaxis protein